MLRASKRRLLGTQNISDYFVFQSARFYLVTNQTINDMHDVKHNYERVNYVCVPKSSTRDSNATVARTTVLVMTASATIEIDFKIYQIGFVYRKPITQLLRSPLYVRDRYSER